jgi:hypothetical protein
LRGLCALLLSLSPAQRGEGRTLVSAAQQPEMARPAQRSEDGWEGEGWLPRVALMIKYNDTATHITRIYQLSNSVILMCDTSDFNLHKVKLQRQTQFQLYQLLLRHFWQPLWIYGA